MNRPLRTVLQGLAVILLPSALMATPARATPAARPDAAEAARCITDHLPRGAQLFRAEDGSFRIVAFGPRGNAARWTVRQVSDSIEVSQSGSQAGTARNLKGVCY